MSNKKNKTMNFILSKEKDDKEEDFHGKIKEGLSGFNVYVEDRWISVHTNAYGVDTPMRAYDWFGKPFEVPNGDSFFIADFIKNKRLEILKQDCEKLGIKLAEENLEIVEIGEKK